MPGIRMSAAYRALPSDFDRESNLRIPRPMSLYCSRGFGATRRGSRVAASSASSPKEIDRSVTGSSTRDDSVRNRSPGTFQRLAAVSMSKPRTAAAAKRADSQQLRAEVEPPVICMPASRRMDSTLR